MARIQTPAGAIPRGCDTTYRGCWRTSRRSSRPTAGSPRARIGVNMAAPDVPDEERSALTEWVNVLANRPAIISRLLNCDKGDLVAVMGNVTKKFYTRHHVARRTAPDRAAVSTRHSNAELDDRPCLRHPHHSDHRRHVAAGQRRHVADDLLLEGPSDGPSRSHGLSVRNSIAMAHSITALIRWGSHERDGIPVDRARLWTRRQRRTACDDRGNPVLDAEGRPKLEWLKRDRPARQPGVAGHRRAREGAARAPRP